MPEGAELGHIYEHEYNYEVHKLIINEKKYRAKKFANYIKKTKGVKKVLEIGCMYGFLLEEFKNTDIEATGVELNKEAATEGQKKGLNIINSSFEDFLKSYNEKYDLAVMSHSLEHIGDPAKELEKLSQILNPGGRLLIIVPNAASLTAKIFGKNWGYWQVPVHINHFDKKSLGYLLENSGYTLEKSKRAGGDSLLFLSIVANMLGMKSTDVELKGLKAKIIQLYSAIVKYWYMLGDEDLITLAKKR